MTQKSLEVLEQAEKELGDRLKSVQKTKALVAKARKELAKSKKPSASLRKLVADFEAAERAGAPVGHVTAELRKDLDRMADQMAHGFRDALTAAATTAGLDVHQSVNDLTLGPFRLRVDLAKETASLSFAHVEIEKGLPLDPAALVARAVKLRADLLAPPGDLAALASDVDEAARVVLARQRKFSPAADLRADLPAVYRELVFIRQGRTKAATKTTFKDYTLARFVVELAALVRSDFNLESARPVRLETAVIENARNANRSIFIPNDLHKAYGEGSWYQAVVIRG